MNDYALVDRYIGYNTKPDKTNLAAGYLVAGSQDVQSTDGNRFGKRKGYVLDGQADTTAAGVISAFDFETSKGAERNVRVANGKVQARYVAAAGDKYNGITFTSGQIYWITIMSGLTAAQEYCNFATFYDFSSEKVTFMLFVNGADNIKEWNPAITTAASGTMNTITKTGTTTWAEEGFNTAHNKVITIDGVDYTYTGGESTTTLTGVTPSAAAVVANAVVYQKVLTTANSSMTGLPAAFGNTTISNLNNQIYVGSSKYNDCYLSKVNNYKDYSFSSPRTQGEGARFVLDASNPFFAPQEDTMYISAGKNRWYEISFDLQTSSTTFIESATAIPLKTSAGQGAFSQAGIFKAKNSVMLINNEPALDELDRITNNFQYPRVANYSDPIKPNFDAYDFTNCSGAYFRNDMYIAVPAEGLILIYNIDLGYWEPPQSIPVSRFSVIGGELYGHSLGNPQTFKLFEGNSDNGFPINAKAYFSYQNYGTRSRMKVFTGLYVEGYMSGNTSLTVSSIFEIDGCARVSSYTLSGDDRQIVCLIGNDASLGKVALGQNSLGGTSIVQAVLPPKFRADVPFNDYPFYEHQIVFSSNDADSEWSILAFGPQVSMAPDDNNAIRK